MRKALFLPLMAKETGDRGMSGSQVEFVVANRFVATVQSTRVPDIGVLYSLIDAIDRAALEKLRQGYASARLHRHGKGPLLLCLRHSSFRIHYSPHPPAFRSLFAAP